MIDIHLISQCTIEPEVDCLIIPAFEDALNKAVSSKLILPEDKTILDLLIEKGDIDGKDNFYLPTPLSPYQSIMILGLGKKADLKCSTFREIAGKVSKNFQKLKKTHLLLEMAQTSQVLESEQFVEAIVLGQYSYDEFKDIPEDKKPVSISEICIHVNDDVDITIAQAKANMAQTKCESANWARNLANKPGNALTPTILAQEAEAMAKETGAEFEVFDEKKMKSLGMNSLLAVSQGSDEEAKLIFIKHTHPDAKKTIAIVGKGLTFDAGGISLKPGKGMEEMKFDMCGAAAVLGAMRNICIIKPAVNVICVVPSSENLINGKAVKPGDIVKAYNGKTIEIYNTDAEGRLILADALAYTAEKYKPDMMVDLATLTGACIVALGHHLGGLMSKDEAMIKALSSAGEKVHERLWRLPMNDEYGELLKGKDADLCNIGPPYAGTVTAGCFLSNFVGKDTRWAHLDIAGVAWNMKGASYIDEKLASGFGVRLLTKWILNESE
ncbi:MAG: leucyl aminopeptidase [Lentisphaeraceae bacterium]|nr:leucyl aminopeptidase [Lentisphaeraceae bacterium]